MGEAQGAGEKIVQLLLLVIFFIGAGGGSFTLPLLMLALFPLFT